MFKKTVGMFALAMLLASSAVAAPVSINFGTYASGTAITNQIAGVSFSLMGGPHSDGAPVTGGFGGPGLGNSTTTDYPTAAILNVKFDGVASNVFFTFDNYGWNSWGAGATFFSAFNSAGALLETGLVGGGGSFALTSSGIADLQFNNNTGGASNWLFTLNSLQAEVTANDVPEPASLALFGLGALGFAVSRRRIAARRAA
ncbi:PEP-CTERM sorting domain-containing protein [Massilia sp. GCM10020059]|uniref:PEP-CTERM sorting domain-containing protein n=1 Tax=Massilia agrisoli TaxID=2892444 RepID=A0ABS8IQ68_9BURK|nr:PEP-CTERM sorting domain-containing protein [Massilia agrisoli]MCC6070551.1 PEP-CTERM sorting domain-containing protein [Massilia agrisoli]